MKQEIPVVHSGRPSLLRNWISLTGGVIAIGSLFSILLLFLLDMLSKVPNPYVGILTYFIVPMILIMGLVLMVVGAVRERRNLGQMTGGIWPKMVVDLSRSQDRRKM